MTPFGLFLFSWRKFWMAQQCSCITFSKVKKKKKKCLCFWIENGATLSAVFQTKVISSRKLSLLASLFLFLSFFCISSIYTHRSFDRAVVKYFLKDRTKREKERKWIGNWVASLPQEKFSLAKKTCTTRVDHSMPCMEWRASIPLDQPDRVTWELNAILNRSLFLA